MTKARHAYPLIDNFDRDLHAVRKDGIPLPVGKQISQVCEICGGSKPPPYITCDQEEMNYETPIC